LGRHSVWKRRRVFETRLLKVIRRTKMQAHVGDELVVHARRVGEHERHGIVTQIHGEGGNPPYEVRWQDGKEAVFFPSADCTVVPAKDTATDA
jgi:hypothetical protein